MPIRVSLIPWSGMSRSVPATDMLIRLKCPKATTSISRVTRRTGPAHRARSRPATFSVIPEVMGIHLVGATRHLYPLHQFGDGLAVRQDRQRTALMGEVSPGIDAKDVVERG